MRALTPAERDDLLALVKAAREATFEAARLVEQSTQPYFSDTPSKGRAALRTSQLTELDAYDAITRWVCERTGEASPLELILNDDIGSEEATA